MPTAHRGTRPFLLDALRYLRPETFQLLRTSRTIRNVRLSEADINAAVANGKFERCGPHVFQPLPDGVHAVNVFTQSEAKGRRRVITEPNLNGVIRKSELPTITRLSRLERRQRLRTARYMLQIDFEAFYDSIPLPESIRDKFVFHSKQLGFYRLRTLPTGARWSVAVGQAITWTIVDVDTPVFIDTMIDNIMVAAEEGQEREFVRAVRAILERIRQANLLTSPDREELAGWTDEQLLAEAAQSCVFLGEEYTWLEGERQVRNSIKTVTKLDLASRLENYTVRSFASLVSLVSYAVHTTQLNPADMFPIIRMYRALYREVARGRSWNAIVNYVSSSVRQALDHYVPLLVENRYWRIAEPIGATYEDAAYDIVVYTDASASGWGAIARWRDGATRTFQQRWNHDLALRGVTNNRGARMPFNSRHSANAEPHAALVFLRYILSTYPGPVSRIALVTDHYPIVLAQRGESGFRGIGRGQYLNHLYAYTNGLFFDRGIRVVFFYIVGASNPADALSRNFGEGVPDGRVVVREASGMALPQLIQTACPVCEKPERTMG